MATKGMTVFRSNGEDFTINDPNIADEFSSSMAYAVGDHVTYQGNLYVFTTEHVAGAWNSDHVSQIKIGKIIKDVERAAKIGAAMIVPAHSTTPVFTKNGTTISFMSASNIGAKYIEEECRFYSQYVSMAEAISVPHDYWCIWNISENKIEAVSDSNMRNMGTTEYCILFYNNNGVVRGPYEQYLMNSKHEQLNWKSNCIVAPYGSESFSVENSGTSIVITCGRYVVYNDSNHSWRICNMSENPTVTVPHDSFCVYNSTTNEIEVKTDTQLNAMTDLYGMLFYNSYGEMCGPFEMYRNRHRNELNRLLNWKSNCIVAPYGSESFSVENSGTSIVITCGRYVVYNDSNHSWRICNMSENPTITVPHDSFCVYNSTTNEIEVKTDTQLNAMTDLYCMMFYNSNGKMCGPFEMYRNRYQIKELNDIVVSNGASYPNYYNSHVKTKVDTINGKLSAIASGDAFVFVTDIHYPNNQMHSPALVKDVCAKTGITRVLLNGDYINREANSKWDALMQINRVCSLYEYPNIDTYRVVGNHEYNNPAASDDPEYLAKELSSAEMRFAFINPVRDKVVYDPNTISYYFDNEKEKIRYFVGQVTRSSGVVADSLKWVAKQVESVPDDYGVVIFWHTVLSASGGMVHPVNEHFAGIMNAMKAKTTYNYLGFQLDYTNNNFDFIACLSGDYHMDMDYTTTDGALLIATTCDALLQEGDLQRTIGTYTEQAFDVVTINKTQRKINLTRIGAGNDREFTY